MTKTLGSVESITGGLFAAKITELPGASKYFKGSLVTYASELKEKFGIDTSSGTVNKEVALAMAKIGKEILNVDICVSFTGNAGPELLDNQPLGKVFIAINDKVYEKNFHGTRIQIRKMCIDFALAKIKQLL